LVVVLPDLHELAGRELLELHALRVNVLLQKVPQHAQRTDLKHQHPKQLVMLLVQPATLLVQLVLLLLHPVLIADSVCSGALSTAFNASGTACSGASTSYYASGTVYSAAPSSFFPQQTKYSK